ncbi:Uncharacterised protein [Mycolicibacterium smegmatis]|nr:Uncharacterised protein [Mycolicibacterium smegmatis]
MAGPAGGDPARLAVRFTVRVEEPSVIEAEVCQVPRDGTAVELDALLGQVMCNPLG